MVNRISKNIDITYFIHPVFEEVAGLEFIHALETERPVIEGRLQHGHAVVMSDLGC